MNKYKELKYSMNWCNILYQLHEGGKRKKKESFFPGKQVTASHRTLSIDDVIFILQMLRE